MINAADEALAAAVEEIIAAARETVPKLKVRVLTDDEWAQFKDDEDRRRSRTASVAADPGATAATVSDADAEIVDLHDVAARLPALVKIKRDLEYRLPGSGRPLANIALTREQCIDLLALCAGKLEESTERTTTDNLARVRNGEASR